MAIDVLHCLSGRPPHQTLYVLRKKTGDDRAWGRRSAIPPNTLTTSDDRDDAWGFRR